MAGVGTIFNGVLTTKGGGVSTSHPAGLLSTTGGPGKPRAVGPRAWLKMNENGVCTPITIDKHRLSSLLRVPMRDLRVLEPNFSNSYSAAILCRERCMVVHLEQVKLLITAEEVYLQDGHNTTVTRYLPELQRRLLMRKLKLMDSHGVPIYHNHNDSHNEDSDGGYLRYDDKSGGMESELGTKSGGHGVITEETEPYDEGFPHGWGATSPNSGSGGSGSVEIKPEVREEVFLAPESGGKGATARGITENLRLKAKLLSPLGIKLGWKKGFGGGGGKGGGSGKSSSDNYDQLDPSVGRGSTSVQRRHEESQQEELPFELIALEVALECVCNQLEAEQRDIGNEIRPTLEILRKKVSTINLERVRRLKSRLTRLEGRVSKVRTEIQDYLEDDSDMRAMYLTRRLVKEQENFNGGPTPNRQSQGSGSFYSPRFSYAAAAARGSSYRRKSFDRPSAGLQRQMSFEQVPGGVKGGVQGGNKDEAQGQGDDGGQEQRDLFSDEEQAEQEQQDLGYFDPRDEDRDLQEVEDLLETYFAHIDSTFAELEALGEYIDDTEDFVNIQLDSQRNQLIKLELVLTTATLCVTMYGVVAGVFGMNLKNSQEDSKHAFLVVNSVSAVATVIAFILAVVYIKYKKIM
eukprot:CAMPEP_0197597414 /NCGR_PEP_ID=MMETSP1326-20131121/27283_1 /TAXON_ID=1155430 /ORGANISM="Genus nov. species nov., Strain RCC2288" /LENGTH=631 /DNA_ID=CAMNT_0043164087 /DNA_START=36 /DNA_END=1931 /DNA_ORIENTATION=-